MRPDSLGMLAADERLAKFVVVVVCAGRPLPQVFGPFHAVGIAVLEQLLRLAQPCIGGSVDVGGGQELHPMRVQQLHHVPISSVCHLVVETYVESG